jgi:hypothetical protein
MLLVHVFKAGRFSEEVLPEKAVFVGKRCDVAAAEQVVRKVETHFG